VSLFPCFAPEIPCSGRHLDIGSKIAIRYPNKEGREVFGFGFTARAVEYLESQSDAEAGRNPASDLAGLASRGIRDATRAASPLVRSPRRRERKTMGRDFLDARNFSPKERTLTRAVRILEAKVRAGSGPWARPPRCGNGSRCSSPDSSGKCSV
jgi:hypothetical protein